jgi:hypothetical protein
MLPVCFVFPVRDRSVHWKAKYAIDKAMTAVNKKVSASSGNKDLTGRELIRCPEHTKALLRLVFLLTNCKGWTVLLETCFMGRGRLLALPLGFEGSYCNCNCKVSCVWSQPLLAGCVLHLLLFHSMPFRWVRKREMKGGMKIIRPSVMKKCVYCLGKWKDLGNQHLRVLIISFLIRLYCNRT